MRHATHEGVGSVLWDNCEACAERSDNLFIDEDGLKWLGGHAHRFQDKAHMYSVNEMRAMVRLKEMTRIVIKSGILEDLIP